MKGYLVGAIAAIATGLQIMFLAQAISGSTQTAHEAFWLASIIAAIGLIFTDEYRPQMVRWTIFSLTFSSVVAAAVIAIAMTAIAPSNPLENTLFCWLTFTTWTIIVYIMMVHGRKAFHGEPVEVYQTLFGHN